MKDYENYTFEDFFLDDDFRDWVQGTSQNAPFWSAFVLQHPEKKHELSIAENLIRVVSGAETGISEKEIRDEVQTFIEIATAEGEGEGAPASASPPPHPLVKRTSWRYWAMAAVLLIGAGLGWVVLTHPAPYSLSKALAPGSQEKLAETFNDSPHPLRFQLHDGTDVILKPQSRLLYPARFLEQDRIVHLVGEAEFAVSRGSQPFMVYTGEMVTKVLGTRFVVRAYPKDKKYKVQVHSGKVSVYSAQPALTPTNREINGLILTANQEAIFETEARQLSKSLVANPVPLPRAAKENELIYDEEPLSTVLKDLEAHYGIPIQFNESNFQPCKITATLTTESLYEKLDLLCKTVSASYGIVDGQIVVSGKGCE
jgi:transmembrane sensor